jgi:ATP-dependent Lhr-like helicase
MKDADRAMDIEGLKAVLDRIADGSIQCISVDTPVPSPFSHEILNANPYAYLDDAPLEERRARAVELRRSLPASVLGEVGRLDPAAISEVVRDAWPDVRDADELSDVLQTLIAVPAGSGDWTTLYEELVATRRAATARTEGGTFWVAAERARTFSSLFPDARFETVLPAVEVVAARGSGVLHVARMDGAHRTG